MRYSVRRSPRRGAVLIVVLGVLMLLSLLATSFATLQITERQVSRNYLDTVRAKLLAQSGVQDALERDRPDLREAVAFVSGMPAMVEALRRTLPALGLPPGSLFLNH